MILNFIKFKDDNASMTSDNDLSSQLLRSLRQNGVNFKASLIDKVQGQSEKLIETFIHSKPNV